MGPFLVCPETQVLRMGHFLVFAEALVRGPIDGGYVKTFLNGLTGSLK